MIVARLFGIKNINRFIFTFNATDAINMGIKGLLKPGDHAITTYLEHNAVSRALNGLERKNIITATKVGNSPDGFIDPNDIKNTITSQTRLIVMAHAPNVFGTIQPIQEIGRIARENDIIFMVDAAQTTGVCEIDVNKNYIDMLAFTGHKGPLGPTGQGALCGRTRKFRALEGGGRVLSLPPYLSRKNYLSNSKAGRPTQSVLQVSGRGLNMFYQKESKRSENTNKN